MYGKVQFQSFYDTVLKVINITFWKSVGVPKCSVLVTSVVPSLKNSKNIIFSFKPVKNFHIENHSGVDPLDYESDNKNSFSKH